MEVASLAHHGHYSTEETLAGIQSRRFLTCQSNRKTARKACVSQVRTGMLRQVAVQSRGFRTAAAPRPLPRTHRVTGARRAVVWT